ncbi:LGFP repeat family protein [Mycobacterium intracellulare 1956]|uniref:LGFP repeat family protein n=1 Tax=Mycobacterium intracellulare 1956 TaxID=1299331 RepID=X8CI44_MYCIT|nr:LGFP repeat family protein [Mycobacterium intracellulare 1956]
MRKLIGSALVSLTTTALAAVLLAPVATASPIGDAEAAMMAAWEKAGGDTSPLGPRKGDVYPAGEGFALDFDSGKMFFTPATGAKFAYGPILEKYEMLGGPAGSDLGFPAISEVPGLAGPDSRVITFSATDKPVIFWTPEHGPYVVRGAINSAWDKLGSSGGVLGVPVGDETYNGEVSSQKFSGGQVSWNRQTKQFTTEPPGLADQLKGLQVAIDPTAAINMAWRAAGGPNGPLGAKQGGQTPIGGDGIVQNFAGGKVFFTPATGANALETDILAKYESLGGPVGSGLGFPVTNETDGGIGPSSRICTFSAADKPVIFRTAEHGAFVVRGAMKAAWDKLRGPAGKLGAPVGDQAVDGDMISQQFTGGKISWNRAKNTFSTDPANLAPLLSGLQVSGQNQPSSSAMPSHANKFGWHSWWWLAAIPVLVLLVVVAWALFGWRRRRSGADGAAGYAPDQGYDAPWARRTPTSRPSISRRAGRANPSSRPMPRPPRGSAGSVRRRRRATTASSRKTPTRSTPTPSPSSRRRCWRRPTIPMPRPITPTTPTPFPRSPRPRPPTMPPTSTPTTPTPAIRGTSTPTTSIPTSPLRTRRRMPTPSPVPWKPPRPRMSIPTSRSLRRKSNPRTMSPRSPTCPGRRGRAVGAGAAGAFVAAQRSGGRHAAADDAEEGSENGLAGPDGRPTIHLPLDDPYQAPDGYPIKASARYGLYYTPGSDLYQDTLPEIWLSSEEVALANGFTRAD